MTKTSRLRKKRDGTYELPMECPACGGNHMEFNASKGVYHCFSCRSGGFAPSEWGPTLSSLSSRFGDVPRTEPLPTPKAVVAALRPQLPMLAKQELSRRGFEEAWIVNRYGVRWDGERLCWPAGAGWSRRSVLTWERPKTLTVAPKGLIGEHLLTQGCRVVVVEGDWKAAAVPLPWVGVGLMGLEMNDAQKWAILSKNPASVTVMLDGGFVYPAERIREALLPLRANVISLPDGQGPDDIPRRDLVRLLLERAGV